MITNASVQIAFMDQTAATVSQIHIKYDSFQKLRETEKLLSYMYYRLISTGKLLMRENGIYTNCTLAMTMLIDFVFFKNCLSTISSCYKLLSY